MWAIPSLMGRTCNTESPHIHHLCYWQTLYIWYNSFPNGHCFLNSTLYILILNLPTNIYKSSNNKKCQQKSTNLPTIKLYQQKSTNLPTNIYKSSNNKTVQQKSTNLPTNIYKSSNNKRYQQKPTSTALYWPRTTKYQLGTAYTDPELPSTN